MELIRQKGESMKIYLFIQDHQMFYDSVIKFSCEKRNSRKYFGRMRNRKW